jgi:hypothetical protein
MLGITVQDCSRKIGTNPPPWTRRAYASRLTMKSRILLYFIVPLAEERRNVFFNPVLQR